MVGDAGLEPWLCGKPGQGRVGCDTTATRKVKACLSNGRRFRVTCVECWALLRCCLPSREPASISSLFQQQALDGGDGLQNVAQTLGGIPPTGSASWSTRLRMRALSPFSVTTSTGRPKADSSSVCRPPRSERNLPVSISIRESMSLNSSARPRATEPKTRSFRPKVAFEPPFIGGRGRVAIRPEPRIWRCLDDRIGAHREGNNRGRGGKL